MGISKKAEIVQLNKRQVSEIRADLMRSARQICNRLMETVVGKKHTEQCECGKEYEVFIGSDLSLTAPQVAAAKTVLQKVFPDISPEDFESAVDTPKSRDELLTQVADIMADKSVMQGVIAKHPQQAVALRDYLIERLGNAVSIGPDRQAAAG